MNPNEHERIVDKARFHALCELRRLIRATITQPSIRDEMIALVAREGVSTGVVERVEK